MKTIEQQKADMLDEMVGYLREFDARTLELGFGGDFLDILQKYDVIEQCTPLKRETDSDFSKGPDRTMIAATIMGGVMGRSGDWGGITKQGIENLCTQAVCATDSLIKALEG